MCTENTLYTGDTQYNHQDLQALHSNEHILHELQVYCTCNKPLPSCMYQINCCASTHNTIDYTTYTTPYQLHSGPCSLQGVHCISMGHINERGLVNRKKLITQSTRERQKEVVGFNSNIVCKCFQHTLHKQ